MIFKKLASLMPILIFVAACTKTGFNSDASLEIDGHAIIGGTKASRSDAVTRSTVSLLFDDEGDALSVCTGTLISRNLVLTAAHCLTSKRFSRLYVFFGKNLPTTFDRESVFDIEKIVVHPDFNKTLDKDGFVITARNDIALIKLAGKAPSVNTVAILDESVQLHAGSTLLLAGYGVVNEIGDQVDADGLNYVRVPLAELWESMIITDQRKAMGACAGDSGGPAYLETSKGLILVGVTRGPHGRVNDCRHFGEYTNATLFKKFILDQARLLKAEFPWFEKHP